LLRRQCGYEGTDHTARGYACEAENGTSDDCAHDSDGDVAQNPEATASEASPQTNES